MDDIILLGIDLQENKQIQSFFDLTFTIKDLGTLKYFLGLEIVRSSKGIHLSQRKCTLELLSDSGLLACKLSFIPMDYSCRLSQTKGEPFADPAVYRRLVGKLVYLTTSGPDITFPVQ